MFCSQCQSFWKAAFNNAKIPTTISSCENIKWTRYETVHHRRMRDVKRSSDLRCPICRAILFTPTVREHESLLADNDELIDIVLDIDPCRGSHPALSVSFLEAPEKGGGESARIPRRMLAAYAGLLTDGDLTSTLARTAQLDNDSTGSDAALELASFWLRRCLSHHEKCGQTHSAGKTFVPTRLVDVKDSTIRLVEAARELGEKDFELQYVALSHCWGKIQIIRTLNKSYKQYLNEIPVSQLSKTFREAIYTTRKLSFRYLWIDSLCIIQDNSDDWHAEAATMCDIYRNATLTIAAAHAPGGDVGCFEERDGILQFPFLVTVPRTTTSDEKDPTNAQIMFTSYGRGKALIAPGPPLYGRAWVLQEQLLSPRMLIFEGSRIRWECLCMHGSERNPKRDILRHIGDHKAAIRSGIMDDVDFFNSPALEQFDFAARSQHRYWCDTVMDYTHRGMTKPSDRLVALDGIANALGQKTTNKYLAGLWQQHLWIGMLWSVVTPTTKDAFNLEENLHIRHDKDIAPSWSWVSVTAPVIYPSLDIVFIQCICEIISAQVSGIPSYGQTGRIKIRGHTRTGYVKSIYPYSICEAAEAAPSMTRAKFTPFGERFAYRGRSFRPDNFFIFSDANPASIVNRLISTNWRLVRGTWRPDQIVDPQTEITFIAIAQQNSTEVPRHRETDPRLVYAVGLVPTGNVEGEYRRVGFAVWEECAWYGYLCGHKSRPGRDIEKTEGWRGMLASRDIEKYGPPKEPHDHRFVPDALPVIEKYDAKISVREQVIAIV